MRYWNRGSKSDKKECSPWSCFFRKGPGMAKSQSLLIVALLALGAVSGCQQERPASMVEALGMTAVVCSTVMHTLEDKERLAGEALRPFVERTAGAGR